MNTNFFILAAACLLATVAIPAYAHPGNVASDGGHYCWTNCDYWGVPYGVKHYHNESSSTSSSNKSSTSWAAYNRHVAKCNQLEKNAETILDRTNLILTYSCNISTMISLKPPYPREEEYQCTNLFQQSEDLNNEIQGFKEKATISSARILLLKAQQFQTVHSLITLRRCDYQDHYLVVKNAVLSKQIPKMVEKVFSQVYGRKITPSESKYWKQRARTDKQSEVSLKGAMEFSKARGVKH